MEIRNNTSLNRTSFGMAFIKPGPEVMGIFTDYVTAHDPKASRLAKRGLAKIVEKQSKMKHFDIEYKAPAEILVSSKSDKATQMLKDGQLSSIINKEGTPGVREKFNNKYSKTFVSASLLEAKIKQFFIDVEMMCDMIKRRILIEFKPEDVLPQNLRTASQNVLELEAAVEKQIAKETVKAELAAKEAAQKRKAIQIIESAFESKNKK